jgi:hypothetical protein
MKLAGDAWSLWKVSNPVVGKSSGTSFYRKSTEVMETLYTVRINFNHMSSMALQSTFFENKTIHSSFSRTKRFLRKK